MREDSKDGAGALPADGSPAVSRRTFVAGAALTAAATVTVGAEAAPSRRHRAAADPVRIAVVGAGGRGADNLRDLRDTDSVIVALCDCDARRAADSFRAYPKAAQFSDWRRMFDHAGDFDAVLVATPDHNHAIVSIAAMKLGKHVYCEKPLAHSVWEARQMAKVAAETRVATQMGTQGHAFEGTRQAVEVVRSGAIGEVAELHVWTDRPAGWWAQGIVRPPDTPPVPEGLDWDVWLGPAPRRPYNPAYVPFTWRGFWDFGTGAIGDMGIHNLDTAFWALGLGAPTTVQVKECSPAIGSAEMKETAPLASVIELQFPARQSMPAVKMTWYDGGKLPPEELFQGEPRISKDGGSLIVGSRGTLFTRTWHGGETKSDWFVLLPRKQFLDYVPPPPSLPRTKSHHDEWVDACRGGAATQSPFEYAAVLTESLLLGNVALRTGAKLDWDATRMHASGCPEADRYLRPQLRKGWRL
ncbi:MAG TPA: Gfo/Idh/MocA family oxidoreductase [Chthonomonadaceae bacterium]|nr:Gfo/Idh/MocA family oxidoreductase [Chthonomonadaceae bacterium]